MYNSIEVCFYVSRVNLAALVSIRIPASVHESIQVELMRVTFRCSGPDDVVALMTALSRANLTLSE